MFSSHSWPSLQNILPPVDCELFSLWAKCICYIFWWHQNDSQSFYLLLSSLLVWLVGWFFTVRYEGTRKVKLVMMCVYISIRLLDDSRGMTSTKPRLSSCQIEGRSKTVTPVCHTSCLSRSVTLLPSFQRLWQTVLINSLIEFFYICLIVRTLSNNSRIYTFINI